MRGSQRPKQASTLSTGSFLLMYLILLLLLGIPLMYMEMVIGQWLRMDNIRAWKYMVPWLSGVGYSSMLVGVGQQSHRCPVSSLLCDASNPPSPPQACALVILYNSALVSWSLYYLGQSFDYPTPWENCPLVKNFSKSVRRGTGRCKS